MMCRKHITVYDADQAPAATASPRSHGRTGRYLLRSGSDLALVGEPVPPLDGRAISPTGWSGSAYAGAPGSVCRRLRDSDEAAGGGNPGVGGSDGGGLAWPHDQSGENPDRAVAQSEW